jgi:hypothetical protein
MTSERCFTQTDLGPKLIGIVQLPGSDQTDHHEVYLPLIERPTPDPIP